MQAGVRAITAAAVRSHAQQKVAGDDSDVKLLSASQCRALIRVASRKVTEKGGKPEPASAIHHR